MTDDRFESLTRLLQQQQDRQQQQIRAQEALGKAIIRQQNALTVSLKKNFPDPQASDSASSLRPGKKMRQIDRLFGKTMGNMSRELEKFARTGSFNLRRFITSTLQSILESQIRVQTQSRSGTLISGLGSLAAGIFHHGGVVGKDHPRTLVPANLFDHAPRHHLGAKLRYGIGPAEYPAILQRGETVLPASVTASDSKTRLDLHVHHHPDQRVRTERSTQADGSGRIDVYVESVENYISTRMLRGEGLSPAIEQRYGLSARPQG